jgi:acyl-CoA thioesterase FadM
MNLYLRLIWMLLRRFFVSKPLGIFDVCKTDFIVNPLDLDVNFHMNNGRYLSIMDLGRVDLMIRAGVFARLVKNGYYPVVVSESIRFKKSLELFDKFEVFTQTESWDEKNFFMQQKFIRYGEVVAEGYIKARFKQRGRKGSVPTAEIFKIGGQNYEGDNLSEIAKAQNAMDGVLGL